MAQTTASGQTKKPYVPKQLINAFQVSLLLGTMRAKGYGKRTSIAVFTKLSNAKNFNDITFDEAKYLINRLQDVTHEGLDDYINGRKTAREMGVPPYFPNLNKYKGRGRQH